MNFIAIFLTVVFVAYMILTDRIVGTSFSISDSWYSWKRIKKEWMFIIFLLCISLGLFLIVEETEWKHRASPWLLVIGACTNWLIGLFGNFKQGWRESMYHNIFSVATFACVLIAFAIEGITFPIVGFSIICAALVPIDIAKKTTIIESVGIGLSVAAIFYL